MPSTRDYRYLDDPDDLRGAATALVGGAVLGHGFGNFYVVTARPEAAAVRRVNVMKGRPPDQVGSVVMTRAHMHRLFDWTLLPPGLDAMRVQALMDALYDLGPFGFRGPAAAGMPAHLTSPDAGINTTQLIAPGFACSCNELLDHVIDRLPVDYLYVTSANRSRHQTGAEDEPAHFESAGLQAAFGHEPDFVLLRHRDEAAARAAYPAHDPMSTTILAFHTLGVGEGGRPSLVVERHGSLPLDVLRPIVAAHGFGLELGPKAMRRLTQRAALEAVSVGAGA